MNRTTTADNLSADEASIALSLIPHSNESAAAADYYKNLSSSERISSVAEDLGYAPTASRLPQETVILTVITGFVTVAIAVVVAAALGWELGLLVVGLVAAKKIGERLGSKRSMA